MALPTLVQSAIGSASPSGTLAFPSNVTAGNLLHIIAIWYDPSNSHPANTPTDSKGNTYKDSYNAITRWNTGTANAFHLQEWWAIANASGSNTVTYSAGSGSDIEICIAEYTGIGSIQPYVNGTETVNNSGSTTADSGNIALDNGPYLLVGFCGDSGGDVTDDTINNGFTQIQQEHAYRFCAAYKVVDGSPGNYAANFTIPSSQKWGCRLTVFRANDIDAAGFVAPTMSTAVTDAADSSTGGQIWSSTNGAIWDSTAGTSGKIILAYQQGANTDPAIQTYDRSSAAWGTRVVIGTATTADGHNQIVLVQDANGFYHVFGSCHAEPMRHWKSNSVRDASAFTEQSTLGADASYPNAYKFSDNTIFVAYRAGGHTEDWVYHLSSDNAATFGSSAAILDSTASNVFYPSFYQYGDDLYIGIVWKDETNSLGSTAPEYNNRYGLYLLKLHWNGSAISASSMGGTSITLPATKSDLDTYCVVEAKADPLMDCTPVTTIGTDGYPALMWIRGKGSYDHKVYFKKWNGSSWDSKVIVCTSGVDSINDTFMVYNLVGRVWVAFINRLNTNQSSTDYAGDGSDANDVGGELHKYLSTDNGSTWVRQGTIKTGCLNFPIPVIGAGSPFKYIVSDRVVIPSTGNMYAWTDYVSMPAFPQRTWRRWPTRR